MVEPEKELVKKNETMEWVKAIVIAAGLVFIIRLFIFAPFIVDGASMEPNFETGERLIVNKIIYSLREPKRGEVIVFHAPNDTRDYIKRVIGLPGETVKVEGDKLYINNVLFEEDYIKDAQIKAADNGGTYNTRNYNIENELEAGVIPEGKIFVMGDNRSNSSDSRVFGAVTYKSIIGRADIIFWPLNKFSFIKHAYSYEVEK
ncbi:MAG TPA: signal peptidase I [Bacilli bacterium]